LILLTPSAHSWKNLTIGCKKSKREIFLVRDGSAAAGDEGNVDAASEFVQDLGGLREEFVLYITEIIKATWIW